MTPIIPAELVAYNSLLRPEDDVSSTGGAIDVDFRPDLVQLAFNDTIEVVSDNAGDTTQVVTVDGRTADGAFVTATATLNGTTPVVLAPGTVFERVLSIDMSADAVGIVTVRRQGAADIYLIPAGERGSYTLFIRSASQAAPITRFEKLFWDNQNSTLTLNAAFVQLTADPAARIRQGVESAKNDASNVANRTSAPGGVVFVDDSVQQSVPSTTLEAGSNIGFWMEQALLAADSPIRSTFTTELAGTTV